jgi:hypothetical protein
MSQLQRRQKRLIHVVLGNSHNEKVFDRHQLERTKDAEQNFPNRLQSVRFNEYSNDAQMCIRCFNFPCFFCLSLNIVGLHGTHTRRPHTPDGRRITDARRASASSVSIFSRLHTPQRPHTMDGTGIADARRASTSSDSDYSPLDPPSLCTIRSSAAYFGSWGIEKGMVLSSLWWTRSVLMFIHSHKWV